jgi:hypothetical protein
VAECRGDGDALGRVVGKEPADEVLCGCIEDEWDGQGTPLEVVKILFGACGDERCATGDEFEEDAAKRPYVNCSVVFSRFENLRRHVVWSAFARV